MSEFMLPEWLRFLLAGVTMFFLMAFSAIALTRAGRSPYWAIFVVIPYFMIVMVWLFAFCRWPKIAKEKT